MTDGGTPAVTEAGRPTALLSRIKHAGWRVLRRIADAVGFDVLWRDYYSVVPRLDELPASFWDGASEMQAIDFDVARQLDFVEHELAPHIAEFQPPADRAAADGGFYLDNPVFARVDAETLYAVVRRFRPRRLVELGSGFSSLVMEAACARNTEEGDSVDYRIFDPYPWLDTPGPHGGAVNRTPATDVARSEFDALGAGDVLFVDTTHTVKAGSDVNHVILDVLPALGEGVIVHFHDIFLPWEYPREFLEEMQWYWAEQYLLQAFLAFNREFEVLFAAHAAARSDPDGLARLVPSFRPGVRPGSFWMRRREN